MEAVCELVTHSRIPWSPEVEALVQSTCGSRLPQVAELERHCQFVQLKSVAHMYNFSPAELEYLPARKPRGIIRKIIYSGAENSLEDALKVVLNSISNSFGNGYGIVNEFTALYRL